MAWSGGNFTRANPTWASDAANGIGIEAGRHDTQDNDFTTGIDQCLNKTGQNGMSGALSMGNNKITNLAAATLRNDAAQVGQVQDGDYIWLGTTAGTATAQTASATPAITAYKAGQKFRMITGFASTGQTPNSHTLNVNSIGAKSITNQDNTNLTAGSFVSGAILEIVYDGTRFKKTNDAGGWQSWTPNISAPIGSVSNVTVIYADYIKVGKLVTITGFISFIGSSVGPQFEITNPPVASTITGAAYIITPCFVVYAGSNNYGYFYNNSGTNFAFTKDVLGSSFGSGTGNVRFTFVYNGQ